MSTSIENIRVYDPTKAPEQASNDPLSTKDMSQNFLRMLTVQLRNQDPMSPMDNAAMTAQLAQLNMVDGINKLNNTVASMMSQLQAANQIALSSSVGKSVLAQGNQVYFSGQLVSMAAQLESPAKSLTASLLDGNGREVNRFDLGSAKAGVTDFIWDGTNAQGEQVPDGIYSLIFKATQSDDSNLEVKSHVSSMVTHVGSEGDEVKLGLADGRDILSTDILKWVAA